MHRVQTHSDLWWRLLQQHQESLQYQVGETRPDGDVVQQTLNVVHHHTAELRLISIVKHLKPPPEAGRARETNEEREKKKCRKKQREESEVKRKEQLKPDSNVP